MPLANWIVSNPGDDDVTVGAFGYTIDDAGDLVFHGRTKKQEIGRIKDGNWTGVVMGQEPDIEIVEERDDAAR